MLKQLSIPTLILLITASAAAAQSTGCPMMGSERSDMIGHEMMGPGMMDQDAMAPATKGHRMMGAGMMGGPGMMRMMMIFMDTDGDGALSLEEMQAVHSRMFKAMDADGNGRLSLEEIQAFMQGGGLAATHP